MPDQSVMNEFFVVALPGMEDIVRDELRDWFPELEGAVSHGGVTVHAPLAVGLSFNLCLKTATRVLLRVASFKSSDFPKLYNKVRSLDWSQWIEPSCELVVHPSTRLSRIKIKRRIVETCEDAWMDYQKERGAVKLRGRRANLYVRFIEDQCTLSLDTSGERLHKRGEREHIGVAPLRESIAAALLQRVARAHGAGAAAQGRGAEAQGSSLGVEIVDPMMGSGTFLLEAGSWGELADQREFAFESFVAKKIAVPVLKSAPPVVSGLVGFESDKKTMAAARNNLKGLANSARTELDSRARVDRPTRAEQTIRAEQTQAEQPTLVLRNESIFNAEPMPPAAGPRWVFCNPPYGERLKVKEPLGEYYVRLFAAVERVAKPDRACFLLPSKAVKGKFTLPLGWKVLEKRPFVNGGIPVTAFVFGRV